MEISEKTARQWSRLGPRAVYGLAMLELIRENQRVYAMSADLGNSSGLRRLMSEYPEHFINTGIAEQNLIGIASGFAKEGLIPFVSSFAPFITLRCADQIRMNMGYMHLNIKAVGLGSGVSMGHLGYSHYGIEDLSLMRAIPGMTILSPSDCVELVKCVEAAAATEGPIYIRMTGEPGLPIVHGADYPFELGKAEILRTGQNVLIVATGSMVHTAQQTAELLDAEKVSCTVVNMHTIKPLDTDTLDRLAKDVALVAVMEEHSIVGGLGSAVSEHFSLQESPKRVLRLGLPDEYGKAGTYGYMLENAGLTAETLKKTIMEIFQ